MCFWQRFIARAAGALMLIAGCESETPPRLINLRPDAGDSDGGDAAATPDAPRLPLYEVLRLDPTRSEFPDAVAARGPLAYVALRALNRVIEVTPDGAYRAYAEVPSGTTIRGVAFDPTGRMFVTVTGTPAQTGLWRVGAGGGVAALTARDDALRTPSGVTVDASGTVWVTDSDPGAVWRLPSGGSLTRWSMDPALSGGSAVCGSPGAVRTGANGIVVDAAGGAVFVTNSDRSSLVRLAIAADGSAGAVTAFTARDCARLAGAWGLSAGPSGSLLVAASGSHQITRVARDGALSAIDTPVGLLRSPAGLAYDADNDVVWVASSATADAVTPGGSPIPGVARVPVAAR